MVTATDVEFPYPGGLVASINRFTRKDENVYLDAQVLAETLFDDHMAANMLVLGAAYQAGAIAVSAEAIEEAIVLNGVSVQMNTHAFRAGRLFGGDPVWAKSLRRRRLRAVVGRPEARRAARVRPEHPLPPPFLRALGMTRKLKLGKWFDGVFRLLVGLRRLRGTALDPFGYAEVRRVERALPGEYRALVEKALVSLSPETYDRAVKLACLPDVIRGYEAIKLRNVRRFRDEVRALGF